MKFLVDWHRWLFGCELEEIENDLEDYLDASGTLWELFFDGVLERYGLAGKLPWFNSGLQIQGFPHSIESDEFVIALAERLAQELSMDRLCHISSLARSSEQNMESVIQELTETLGRKFQRSPGPPGNSNRG